MNRVDELRESLSAIEMSIRNEEETARDIRESLAKECPVKIGSIVEITGYSYTGKRMRVDWIEWGGKWRWREFGWTVHGSVLRKNNEPGSNLAESFVKYDAKS